jgi:hypothetical protein
MSARAFIGVGATAREAVLADIVAGFELCYASMSWLAREVGVCRRHAFRLAASLKKKALLESIEGDRNAPPPGAKHPARLRHNGFAIRSVVGAGAVIVAAKVSRIAEWRRRKQEEIEQKREKERARKQADAERKRLERAARVATPNPPPAPPPFHRDFPRTEPAPTAPVIGVPASAYAALYGRPPPE